ncbi:hypothetical protein PQR05_29860 [Paraburkholderia sediminicola]
MLQVTRVMLMVCGAAVVGFYALGAVGVGEFRLYYGTTEQLSRSCMEKAI